MQSIYAEPKNWYRDECAGDVEIIDQGPNEFDLRIGGKRASAHFENYKDEK